MQNAAVGLALCEGVIRNRQASAQVELLSWKAACFVQVQQLALQCISGSCNTPLVCPWIACLGVHCFRIGQRGCVIFGLCG